MVGRYNPRSVLQTEGKQKHQKRELTSRQSSYRRTFHHSSQVHAVSRPVAVRPLAVLASKRQIFKLSFSAALLGDDVVNVERTTESILREVTILTPVPGTAMYCRQVCQGCRNTWRAFVGQYASKSPMFT